MVDSVTTNPGSLSALSSLSSSTSDLSETLEEAATGSSVSSALDDAAAFAVAAELSSDLAGLSAVTTSLSSASSVADATLAAGGAVSDTLVDLSELAVAAADPGLSEEAAAALDAEFSATLGTLETLIGSAEFAGSPLLTGEGSISAITSPDASTSISVEAPDFTLGGPVIAVDSSFSLATPADAAAAVTAIESSIAGVSSALSEVGATADAFAGALDFTATLSDTTEVGIGSLVDADLGEVAAELAAETVAVELGVISASISNAAPEGLLTLFDIE